MIKKKDKLYYARIIPHSGIYDIFELVVRTVGEEWFVGIEKRDKRAFLFGFNSLGNSVFYERNDALEKVKEAERNKIEVGTEVFYEEY